MLAKGAPPNGQTLIVPAGLLIKFEPAAVLVQS
jgi:hypothetical protein